MVIESSKRIIASSDDANGFQYIPDVLQTTSTLTVTDLSAGVDNGSYSCRADNEANIGAVLTTSYTLVIVEDGNYSVCYLPFLSLSMSSCTTTSKLL